MKFMIIASLLFLSAGKGYGQVDSSRNYERARILQKQGKDLNTVAWVTLSCGSLCMIIGAVKDVKYNFIISDPSKEEQTKVAEKMMLVGGVVTLASGPLFIISHSKKKKARVILRSEKTGMGTPFPSRSIDGISFIYDLNVTKKKKIQ